MLHGRVCCHHAHAFHSLLPTKQNAGSASQYLNCFTVTVRTKCCLHDKKQHKTARSRVTATGNSLGTPIAAGVSFAIHLCSCRGGILTSCSSKWWSYIGVELSALLQSLPFILMAGRQSSCSGSCTVPSMFILLQLAHPAAQPCSLFPARLQLLG